MELTGKGPQKPHHSYVWLGGIKTAVVILVICLAKGLPEIISELALHDISINIGVVLLIILACFVVAIIVAVLIQFLLWRHLSFVLTETEFCLFSGIFNKHQTHVHYDKIQSVDQKASFIQRIAGVCTLEIDTAGGSTNRAIRVPYITKSTAETLRKELFINKMKCNGELEQNVDYITSVQTENVLDSLSNAIDNKFGIFDSDSFEPERPQFEAGLSNKELFFSGASNAKGVLMGVAAALAGFTGIAGVIIPSYNDELAAAVERITGFIIGAHTFAWVLAGISLLVFATFIVSNILLWAFHIIGSLLSFGGFRVRRTSRRVEVERGLLNHSTQSIDIDKIQCIYIRQNWIRRRMGYAEIALGRIDNASNRGENGKENTVQNGMIIHPFIKVDQVDAFLAQLIPEIPLEANVAQFCPAKRALLRAIYREALWHNGGFWTLIGLMITALCFVAAGSTLEEVTGIKLIGTVRNCMIPCAIITVIIMVVGLIKGCYWHKQSSVSFGVHNAVFDVGGWSRTMTVIPRNKIQFCSAKSNPFQRRLNLDSFIVTTAAGAGNTSTILYDLDEDDALAAYNWVRPRA